MSFPIVAVRTPHHAPDDLFPRIAPRGAPLAPRGAPLAVALEAGDDDPRTVMARDLTVRTQLDGHVRDVVTVRRRPVEVTLTDARVILACHQTGPDHSVLAGHVKYPWLVAVGGSDRDGRSTRDELRLIVQRAGGDFAVVTVGFKEFVDIHGLARDIARRAANRWLAAHSAGHPAGHPAGHSAGTHPNTGLWEKVAAEQPVARRGEFALHWMPDYVRVDASPRLRVESQDVESQGGAHIV